MNDKSEGSSVSMTVSEEEQESIPTTISIQPVTTSNSKKLKKKGVFKKEWTLLKEFSPWLQEVKGDYKQARYKACLKTFSVHYEGKTALQKHMNSRVARSKSYKSEFFCLNSENFGKNI